MDIVERLNLFLDTAGISKSQFADNCKIPRPTASQILSGRNKKISDEIIAKIHSIYPNLSVLWLMFGEGSMFTSEQGDTMSVSGISPESANIFPLPGSDFVSTSKSDVEQKKVSKIVVFYSDNSFEEFYKVR